MTSRSVRSCVNFAGMCLLVMLTMRGIQGYSYQERQPFWNLLYNNRIKPMNNVAQFSNYYPHLPHPHRFPGVPISGNTHWQPYIVNSQLQRNKKSMINNRWINQKNWINNGFAGTANLQFVPMIVFPTIFQQTTTTQRRQEDSPRNEEAVPIDEESSVNRESVEYPEVFQETKQIQQRGEKPREESATTEPTELDRGSIPPCQGKNCRDASENDISRLVEEALRNGELLRLDEWIRKQNTTKKHDTPEQLKDIQEPRDSFDSSNLLNSAPVCYNSTFCVHAAHYPEELVNQAIRRNDSLKLLENVDQVSEIGDRLELDELNDSPFCRSYVRLVYPRSAETTNRRWLYIVNQNNLRQGVRIEICVKEGSTCGDLDDYLSEGYKAFCKQKYVYRELVAVDVNGVVRKDNFRFPSNCCCYRKFVGFGQSMID